MWMEALQADGHQARLTDAGTNLTLRSDHGTASWTVRRFRRTPRPSEVRLKGTAQVLWLPAVTPGLRTRLHAMGASWVSDSGEVHLHTPWGLVSVRAAVPTGLPDRPGRSEASLSAGAYAVLQFLLEHPQPASQHQIALGVGLSQPRISQVLKELSSDGLASRAAGGWRLPEPGRALAAWLAPGTTPAAMTATWYSLASARAQIVAITNQAEAEHAEVRLCGDWAADLLAPWRQPGLIVVHANLTLDLDSANFVPAPADAATVALCVGPIRPDWRPDPDVLAAMAAERSSGPLAPVTEILREITATGGSDASQAVDELTTVWLRARAAVVVRET